MVPLRFRSQAPKYDISSFLLGRIFYKHQIIYMANSKQHSKNNSRETRC